MPAESSSALSAWESFYVIVGSSAAALTGLTFVVITLAAERRHPQTARGIAAFGTPTVVHFSAAFLVAAVFSAPWDAVSSATSVVGVMGLLGIAYTFVVVRRARSQTMYTPVLEDWVWHGLGPLVAYVTFAVSAFTGSGDSPTAEFAIAAGVLLLVFIGIHNSWDAVTWNAMQRGEDSKSHGRSRGGG
jgi:hypothetical protein